MKLKQEKETKFAVSPDLTDEKLVLILTKMGLVYRGTERQRDEYWDTPECRIINLKRGLRVRYADGQPKSIQFKSLFKKQNGEYYVEEVDILERGSVNIGILNNILFERLGVVKNILKSQDNLWDESLFRSAGLKPEVVLAKTRRIYMLGDDIEVAVDDIEGLGKFVEVELKKGDLKSYDAFVRRLMKEGSQMLTITEGSYLDLILGKNANIYTKEEYAQRFEKQYDWNVVDKEKAYVRELVEKV